MMAGRKNKPVVIRTMQDFSERFYPKSQRHTVRDFSDPKNIARELVKETFKGIK